MSMINYASREINCKIVYYGPGLGGKTTQSRARLRQGAARHAGQAHLAGHGDRAHALLRLPASGPGHDPRVQDALPPLHRARPGLLQRQPQAHPQGRRRHRVRGRLADRAHGGESGGHAEPVRQHGRVRVRSHEDAVRHPVQQTRPAQRVDRGRPAGGAQSGLGSRGRGPAARHARPVSRRREPHRPAAHRRMDRARARTSRRSPSPATACSRRCTP